MLENGLEACTCKRTRCERFGKCEECVRHHEEHSKHPPYCKRGLDETMKPKKRGRKEKRTTGD